MRFFAVMVAIVLAAAEVFVLSAFDKPEGISSLSDLDLPGLEEAPLASAVSLKHFTPARLSRLRRDVQYTDEESPCCGNYNADFWKKYNTFWDECLNSMKKKKYEGGEEDKKHQFKFCMFECVYKKGKMCDSEGYIKSGPFTRYCKQLYAEKEVTDLVLSFSSQLSIISNSHAKDIMEKCGTKYCNPAAGVIVDLLKKNILVHCPAKHFKKSEYDKTMDMTRH
ncbi:uncharacterized protein [Periplaneta americana]|uniref:uncharacterized protein n=1 Tax=Periplaneta americana TaxID=6978 RepID=UPI0037E834F0